jgi:hypothetical protein
VAPFHTAIFAERQGLVPCVLEDMKGSQCRKFSAGCGKSKGRIGLVLALEQHDVCAGRGARSKRNGQAKPEGRDEGRAASLDPDPSCIEPM